MLRPAASDTRIPVLRDAIRRHVPLSLRARVMRAARRAVLGGTVMPPTVAIGGFDTPADGAVITGDVIRVVGWALRENGMPWSVDVRLGGVLLGRARLGLGRPDLVALGAEATAAGFELTAPIPAALRGDRAAIVAVVHFQGNRHRLVLDGPTVDLRPRPLPTRRLPILGQAAGTRRRPGPRPGPPHLLAVTHQLDLGGGQFYLQDLLRGLLRGGHVRATVASPVDGPLRAELEGLGAAVHLLTPWPHHSALLYESRLDELAAWARDRQVDAVLANTAMAFPGVHLAHRLGLPALWAIHESYPTPVLWDAVLGAAADPAVRAAAEESLRLPDRLIFEARSTLDLYSAAAGASRCLHLPYGVELAALDADAAGLTRHAARRRLGLREGAQVLLCMGTFEPRKGQTILVRAFSEVADRHPDAVLVLVGENGTEYARAVTALAASTGLGPRVRLEPVGPDVVPWYVAADVLVSASDVESMPRSALEAMALGTPVLAAGAYGVGELVEDGVSGWIVEPRDLGALVEGLDRALVDGNRHRSMGRQAAARVRRDHDAAGYVAAYADMLDDLLADPARPSSAHG